MLLVWFFLFKQKTAYEMRISDWSSDVCSSDLIAAGHPALSRRADPVAGPARPSPDILNRRCRAEAARSTPRRGRAAAPGLRSPESARHDRTDRKSVV